MERESLKKLVVSAHRRIMNEVDASSPPASLRCRVVEVDERKAVLRIINTSVRLKLESLVEEKLYFVEDKCQGVVLEVYDGMVVLQTRRMIRNKEVTLKRDSNYNNKILLEKAVAFFESDKLIHRCIYDSFGI